MPKYHVTFYSGDAFGNIEAKDEKEAEQIAMEKAKKRFKPEILPELEVAAVELEESKIGVNRMEKIKEVENSLIGKIQKLLDKGMNDEEIASELDCKLSDVKEVRNKTFNSFKESTQKIKESLRVYNDINEDGSIGLAEVTRDGDQTLIYSTKKGKYTTFGDKGEPKDFDNLDKAIDFLQKSLGDYKIVVTDSMKKKYRELELKLDESIITIQEEVTIGNVILEKGDRIRVLEQKLNEKALVTITPDLKFETEFILIKNPAGNLVDGIKISLNGKFIVGGDTRPGFGNKVIDKIADCFYDIIDGKF